MATKLTNGQQASRYAVNLAVLGAAMLTLFVVGFGAAVCAMAVMVAVKKNTKSPEPLDDEVRKLNEVLARAERYDPANLQANHRR
jgi:hypothetical protein